MYSMGHIVVEHAMDVLPMKQSSLTALILPITSSIWQLSKQHICIDTKHHKAHLKFAIAHKDWTIEDWKKVIWSDETKINHLDSWVEMGMEKAR